MKPFPPLQKKIEAYEEEKKDEKSLFQLNPNPFTKEAPFPRGQEKTCRKRTGLRSESWT